MSVQVFECPGRYAVRFVDRPTGCERLHTHAYPVVTTVLGGALSLQLGDETCRLSAGEMLQIEPHRPHAVQSFEGDFAGVYTLALMGVDEDGAKLRPESESSFRFIDLCEHLLSREDEWAKAQQLSAWLANVVDSAVVNAEHVRAVPHTETRLAELIKSCLDEELLERVDFDAIARRCGCSKEHCNRQFRARYGVSMQTYHLNRKAEYARSLLATDRPLAQVAQEAGFFDQSHLSRVFKGIFQVTADEYRRKNMV